ETVGARHRRIDHERELCQPPGHVAALHLERVPCSWRAARNDRKTLDLRVCAMRGALQNAGSGCIMHGTLRRSADRMQTGMGRPVSMIPNASRFLPDSLKAAGKRAGPEDEGEVGASRRAT